jgi:hypothetical protein
MCWVGNITDKKVAKTDIEVQKVLMMSDKDVDRFLSPYRYEVYTANEEKKHAIVVDDSIVDEYIIRIDIGLHSYSRKCKIENIQRKPLEGDFVMRFLIVYPKNHDKSKLFGSIFSYSDRIIYSLRRIPVMVKAIIPEGTTYYENKRGEIVSEKLIITNKIL